jgi:hypothetical protein
VEAIIISVKLNSLMLLILLVIIITGYGVELVDILFWSYAWVSFSAA